MGYYSNAAIDKKVHREDHSCTSHRQQLQWRLEALEARLQELGGESRCCFSESDLRYALPEDFRSVPDVKAAIALTVQELAGRYGICAREEETTQAVDELTGMQISLLEFFPVPTPFAA